MTTSQLTELLGEESLDTYTGEDKLFISLHDVIFSFSVSKTKYVLSSEVSRTRFHFDTDVEVMSVAYCRKFSTTNQYPPHGNYDVIDIDGVSTVYEYLTNPNGDIIVDYYPFSSITIVNF
jgi:hypothetical protein